MKPNIRQIGNSKEINIKVKDDRTISAPVEVKRKGWDAAFKEMAANGDDKLVIPNVFKDENSAEWTW
jgi:antitoxin MazE